MNYIALDLEFNQFFDFKHKSRPNHIKGCSFEIIQIGLVKLDSDFNIIANENFYIKSNIYKRIHPFVQKITGINSAMLKNEPSFPEVYTKFIEFIGGDDNILCVWGGSDISALCSNVKYYNLDISQMPRTYINVQSLACEHFGNPSGVAIGLKNAIEKLEILIDSEFHNALNDAMYTAKIFKIVSTKLKPEHKIEIGSIKDTSVAPVKDFNTSKLYKAVELEFGRKLTTKEKKIVRNIYIMGKNGIFNK
jgi:DNA polymerase III epsilon subunit-like protein